MRIAIMADIHGNPIALDAVLGDIERRGGVDAYWILGDIVALGHAPVEVLERLSALPNVRWVRGNTDRYVCTGDRPPPSLQEAVADPTQLPVLLEVAGTFAWTQGAVTYAGWLEWLSGLPLELRTGLPDGTRVLGVHAAPGRDDGIGFQPGLSDAELAVLLGDSDTDLVCVGHTHQPMEATVKGTHVVNVGSVSNPVAPDLRASYVLLKADPSGHRVEHRRVEYDREAVIVALQRLWHPGAKFIVGHMRGLHRPALRRPRQADAGRPAPDRNTRRSR
jgi:predicted phosphodiesterase